MCGIAGIFNMDHTSAVPLADVESMVATLRHRGPDARGSRVYDGATGLGHTRLSILDLSAAANQPFELDDGALAITYNGEIFNYVELRDELEGRGHRFRTRSDTEVLLHAYREWGEEAVPRLNGMWAFAIWDRERDRLFCSRDRFGIKPFAYTRVRGRFLFASEIKALLAVEPELASPDFTSLAMLLRATEGYRLSESCFAGVSRVPPAHNLVVGRHGLELRRYWDYPSESDESLSPDAAADGLRERLVDAIRIRMRSDVPVGSTLSAGLDSSSIACLLRTFYDGELDTFTASYADDPFDEAARAQELARGLDFQPHPVPALPEEFLPTLRACIRHLEGPSRTPQLLPVWNIMRAAREKVTVVLEGQGADELLAGYADQCFPALLRDHLRHGRLGPAAAELGWQARAQGVPRTAYWLARSAVPATQRGLAALRGDAFVLSGELAAAAPGAAGRSDPLPRMDDPLNALLRQQHEGGLVDLLHYGDALSMAHSLESRLPFMDVRLVEWCFRLPGRLKLRAGRGKEVLRHAVRRDVPADIVRARRKQAFTTPTERWFRESPQETVHPVLLSESCRRRGVFSMPRLEAALERHRNGRVDLSNQIFRWLTTEIWFQEFIDRR